MMGRDNRRISDTCSPLKSTNAAKNGDSFSDTYQ